MTLTAAERQKRLREKRRSSGLCVSCGKSDAINGIRCKDCQKTHNTKTAARRQRCAENGQCRDCGDPSSGFKLCKSCRKKAAAAVLAKANLKKLAGKCRRCGVDAATAYCPACRRKFKEARHRLLREVYEHYGGAKCACCGEDEFLFLTIDHINNDGAAHRRTLPYGKYTTGVNLARWLRDNGFPPGFQVLCSNCNLGKQRNGGVCPHQAAKLVV